MGPHGPPLLLGVLLLLGAASTEDVKIVNGFVGGTSQMVPVFVGDPHGFEWKKGTDKIIEVDFPRDPILYNLFTNRSHFNDTTGVLATKDLQLNDSGIYSSHVLVNQAYQITTFQLTVFPALHKPTLNYTATDTSVVIRCRHDPDPPTYEWYNEGHLVTSNRHNYSLTDGNRSLTVDHADLKSLKSLECVVRNPATENRTSVQETLGTESRSRSRLVLIAAVVTVLLILLLILLIIYGIFGPENSFLRRFFNSSRNRIQRFFNSSRNRIQRYQAAARSDPEIELNSMRASNSEGGQSDNMNRDTLRNTSVAHGESGDEGATSAPETTPEDLKTHPNGSELVNESHEERALINNPTQVQSKESRNTVES